ncbi:acetylglutamate kinase, partial [bacterium]|nr:acetylglutamate kinase [bacterium]
IVEDVIVNEVNSWLVDKINSLGHSAVQISGKTGRMIRVKKLTGKNEKGENIDWGFVGKIQRINPRPIFDVMLEGRIPVIAPLGVDLDGNVYNVNADTIASEIASSLTAEKLVYLTDVQGIFRNIKDENSLLSTIKVDEVSKLKNDGIISGGMIPKIDACLEALKNHVHKTHIISGKTPHSLLLEIFTDKGVGTEII